MAAHVQDAIMLLGDSLTQGGFDLNGFAAKLARTPVLRLYPARDMH